MLLLKLVESTEELLSFYSHFGPLHDFNTGQISGESNLNLLRKCLSYFSLCLIFWFIDK